MLCPLKLDLMAKKVIDMLEKALDSLVNTDPDLARTVLELDEEVDTIHSQNCRAFKDYVRQNPETVDSALSYLTSPDTSKGSPTWPPTLLKT